MADWKYKINISQVWRAFEESTVNFDEFKNLVVSRLKQVSAINDKDYGYELEEIVDEFEMVEDVEEFDSVLERLYDWADTPLDSGYPTKRLCWIQK